MAGEYTSKTERAITSREFAEQKQTELNEVLARIVPEISLWNEMLRDGAESSYGEDASFDMAKMKTDAISYFDEKWKPFMGHAMHVSGKWNIPTIVPHGPSLEVHMEECDAFAVAVSNGFQVLENETGIPRLGLSFALSNGKIVNAAMQGNITLLGFAEPSQVSLLYAYPSESQLNRESSSEFVERLVLLDRLLTLHYADDHSELFRQTINKQQKFFASITDTLNEVLTPPIAGDRAYCTEVKVPYIWQRVQKEGRTIWRKQQPEDGQNLIITGALKYVEILEAIDQKSPLTQTGDLIDPDAGPCLVVKVLESNADDELKGHEVYLPVRQALSLPIAIY